MKILLIEDNKEISDNIKSYLELEEYKVNVCYDWINWLDEAFSWTYDLILLDLMLPWIDWIRLAEKLKWKQKAPIIIITSKESINDKLSWFESWAIDYLVKPFDLRELDARIKIALKKNEGTITIWKLELNFKDRIFKKSNSEISLWKTEFEILKILFESKHKVVSRTEIIEEIWWENAIFESDSKLDVYISMIRNKLEKDIIVTSKWVWYKFNY